MIRLSAAFISFLGLVSIRSIIGVDHSLFKSCVQSGFCNRNRVMAEHILNGDLIKSWKVDDVSSQGSRLNFKLSRSSKELTASLQSLSSGALKLSIEDEKSEARYKIPHGDVIVEESESLLNIFESAVEEGENVYFVKGTGLKVKINADPFSIEIISETDGEILKLNSQNLFSFETGEAFDISEVIKNIDENTKTELWKEPEFFERQPDPRKKGPTSMGLDIAFVKSRAVYGIPEHAASLSLNSTRGRNEPNGKVFTRSDPFRLFNLDVFEYELDSKMALYGAIPIMLGHDPKGSKHRSVGVFWNNPSETWVDIYDHHAADGKLTHWMSESGSFSLYILAGKNMKELQKIIRTLVGAPQLPPSFSLGYHQCRWNYKSVADVLDVHANFDKYNLPFDVIWLDIEHTDGKKYMSWDPTHFAEPEKMTSEISRTGRKLVTIVDPHLKKDKGWGVYNEIAQKKLAVKSKSGEGDFEGRCWPGNSVWTDYSNPEARNWWSSLFSFDKYKKSTEDVYIWNDMNEPSVFGGPEGTMPRDNIHHGGVEHRDLHNVYGMYQHMSTYNGLYQRSQGRKRPFVLSRSFYAGSQRFGAIWTGDNFAEWGHLKASGPMLMSLGVVGYHFAGADVGGFFGNPSTELLVRWYQAGSMQPFFRGHAHIDTQRREPWLFGETVTSQIRNVLRLRYSLLPVWYTAMEESSRTGVPPMRPMFLEFPDDENLLNVEDQWMVSSSLLFKPITTAGQVSSQVILPQSNIWYNYFSKNVVDNADGSVTEINLTLDSILLYIRGGSIFARKDTPRRSSKAMQFDPMTLVVALDRDGQAHGSLYVDDGDSFDYKEKGAFTSIEFAANVQDSENVLNLGFEVSGNTELVHVDSLKINQIVLLKSDKQIELPVDLYLGKSAYHKINL